MVNEKRLIDANALKEVFDDRYDDAFMQARTRPNIAWWDGYSAGVNWARNTINDAPTVDAVEVVHGKAVPIYSDIDYEDTLIRMDRQCNKCGALITQMDNYCPNCGAKMDGDGNA